MTVSFQLDTPLPARGSAQVLRDRLIEHLIKTSPPVGARFLSDKELAEVAKLSRPTVRRALEDLRREGWIERRHGSGTFVGPRVAMPLTARREDAASPQRITRLGIMIHLLGDLGHDWYSRGVLGGIDEAADDAGIAIELLGDRDGDVKSVSRRLMQTRPDVLAFTAPPPRHTMLIGECQRLDIPCIGTGTYLATLNIPTVCEDSMQGSQEAVRHLVEQGHERIGVVLFPYAMPWVFYRRQGYIDGLVEAGIEPDEGLVLWLSGASAKENAELIDRYLDRRKPSALLFTNYAMLPILASLIRDKGLSIPRDLSMVTFDQHPDAGLWLGDVQPTTVALPLDRMGRSLVEMAKAIVDGREPKTLTVLPCELIRGESVASRR